MTTNKFQENDLENFALSREKGHNCKILVKTRFERRLGEKRAEKAQHRWLCEHFAQDAPNMAFL
jgi:hypothetical protein